MAPTTPCSQVTAFRLPCPSTCPSDSSLSRLLQIRKSAHGNANGSNNQGLMAPTPRVKWRQRLGHAQHHANGFKYTLTLERVMPVAQRTRPGNGSKGTASGRWLQDTATQSVRLMASTPRGQWLQRRWSNGTKDTAPIEACTESTVKVHTPVFCGP